MEKMQTTHRTKDKPLCKRKTKNSNALKSTELLDESDKENDQKRRKKQPLKNEISLKICVLMISYI